jgi:phosphoenolpyruvate carboxylase
LLQESPVVQRSIQLRNPYVDPINMVQVELMCRSRLVAESDPRHHCLDRGLMITVAGIAAGMRNTG